MQRRKNPKFIQITSTSVSSSVDPCVYALDELGHVWGYQFDLNQWYRLEDKRE